MSAPGSIEMLTAWRAAFWPSMPLAKHAAGQTEAIRDDDWDE